MPAAGSASDAPDASGSGAEPPDGAGPGDLAAAEALADRVERADGPGAALADLLALERRVLGLLAAGPAGEGRDLVAVAAGAVRAEAARLPGPLAAQAGRLVAGRVLARAQALVAGLPAPGDRATQAAFGGLARLTLLERDLHALGPGSAAGAGPVDGVGDGDPGAARDAARPLHGVRERLRARLLDGLREAPPDAAQRQRQARELRDRAAAVRTGLDDLPPVRAARHLEGVADDLAWHAAAVEGGAGRRARALRRAARRLGAAAQERRLEARLIERLGARRAAAWERLVVVSILTVLGLLLLEALLPLPVAARWALVAIDTLACGVLLADFGLRLVNVPHGRGRWFARHLWLDLLPSLPLSWLSLAHVGGEPLHAGVGLRVVQLPRFARTLRFLMPVLRLLRVVGFLARGLDRLERAYGRLLDRDVVLYPTREERAAARARATGVGARAADLLARLGQAWQRLLAGAAPAERSALLGARLAGLAEAARDLPVPGAAAEPAPPPSSEVTGEVLLERWSAATPAAVAAALEPELVARLAASLRVLARAPLRWTPFLRRYLPRLAPGASDAAVVAAAAQSSAAELGRHHRRWLWFADLYGTLTPAEFVDRLGNALVRSSFRPAYRLTLFGAVYLIVSLLVGLVGGAFLQGLLRTLNPFVTDTLVVLGGICFAVLGLGWWMRRVASQSTAFYEALSDAQFLELLETLKGRRLAHDAAALARRVLEPEAALVGAAPEARARAEAFEAAVRAWLVEPQQGRGAAHTFDAAGRVALIYRDALDGALFLESDARTARQLLGNPLLAGLRRRSWRTTRAELRALSWLDLDRPRSTLRGPYVWFSFLAQAVVQTVGRLLADYNRSVLPLSELSRASTEERARHESWLHARQGARAAAGAGPGGAEEGGVGEGERASGDFIALHFLDDDPARDAEVAQRYGPEVLAHLRADRRFLIRRIFGTYPLHLRPRGERVLNLRRLYERWFARGRALLLPARLLLRAAAFVGLFLRWVLRALHEVRRPALRAAAEEAAQADFATALRKIDRVRGPLADALLRQRARVDVEYLGLACSGGTASPGPVPVLADLAFLGGRSALAVEVAREREEAAADLARLRGLVEGGLVARVSARLGASSEAFTPEHARALALAYRADLDGVRSLLSAEALCAERLGASPGSALPAVCPLRRWRRWRRFRAWWREHGRGGREDRRRAWRAAAHDEAGVGRALDVLASHRPEASRALGEARLAEALRHPARLTETLVTLRAVQTLSLIDVHTYREHVYRVGGYAESGDPAAPPLPG